MKTLIAPLISISVFFLVLACSEQPNVWRDIANGRAKPPTPEELFEMDTRNLDKNGQTLACGDMYKLIGDSCVLRIDGELKPRINYGHIIVDADNSEQIELWVFKKGKASLTNLCTDLIVTIEGEEPKKPPVRMHPERGSIVMAEETSTEELDGIKYTLPVRSVLIEHLVFKDFSGKTITLTNELIWKVKDSGTPG